MYFYELHEGDEEVFSDVLLATEQEMDADEFFELVQSIRRSVQDTYEDDTLIEAIAAELERDHEFVYVSDERLTAAVNVSVVEEENVLISIDQVDEAADGKEALTKLLEGGYDLLVTDWNMPDIDGLELCRRLRAPGRKVYTYVIILTMLSGKSSYLEALAAGADDFMSKPVDPDELAARLKVGERIVGLQKEMRQMQGLLSICMMCKKIREGEEWIPVERYVAARTATSFTHGLCPECSKKLYPEYFEDTEIKK